jgi:uncharacterized glyoxalase superfamily protein PhnB
VLKYQYPYVIQKAKYRGILLMIAPILAVKDLDASLAFYSEKLGFEKVIVMEGADGKNSFAFVGMGEQIQFGLSAQPAPAPLGSGVVFMIYPPEEVNLDQLYADMRSRGVAIEQPLRDDYWGDRTFSVKDADGYYLTFSVTAMNVPEEELADIMKKGITQA